VTGIIDNAFLLTFWHLHSADARETDVRPLEDEESVRLRKVLPFLLEFLSPGDCISHLYSRECISRSQAERIQKQTDRDKQVSQLVDILSRRSFRDMRQFVAILYEIGQGHVAERLVEGGGQLT
jgi:hypothetical protein